MAAEKKARTHRPTVVQVEHDTGAGAVVILATCPDTDAAVKWCQENATDTEQTLRVVRVLMSLKVVRVQVVKTKVEVQDATV